MHPISPGKTSCCKYTNNSDPIEGKIRFILKNYLDEKDLMGFALKRAAQSYNILSGPFNSIINR